jgi:hypothetical protein
MYSLEWRGVGNGRDMHENVQVLAKSSYKAPEINVSSRHRPRITSASAVLRAGMKLSNRNHWIASHENWRVNLLC